jgi:nucleotide-binding universal stress UspA family protein
MMTSFPISPPAFQDLVVLEVILEEIHSASSPEIADGGAGRNSRLIWINENRIGAAYGEEHTFGISIMLKKILVPTDGSERSERAAQAAVELAGKLGGSLVAISVAESYPFPPISESPYAGGSEAYERRAEEYAREHAAKVAQLAAASSVPCETVVVHAIDPYEAIVDAARQHGCDAIFMASHGRKGLNKVFAGSQTQKVMAHTELPVMVFR